MFSNNKLSNLKGKKMVILEFKSRFHGLLESRYVTTLYSTVYSEMIANQKRKIHMAWAI